MKTPKDYVEMFNRRLRWAGDYETLEAVFAEAIRDARVDELDKAKRRAVKP